MRKELQIEDEMVIFEFNESANCWQTKLIIDKIEIDFEIDFEYHKDAVIDWNHFTNFYNFINQKSTLKEFTERSLPLISEVGKTFYNRNAEHIKDWKMLFRNSIYYNGKDDNKKSGGYSFSLIFDFLNSSGTEINGDEYGLYLVDFENSNIIGGKRIQC